MCEGWQLTGSRPIHSSQSLPISLIMRVPYYQISLIIDIQDCGLRTLQPDRKIWFIVSTQRYAYADTRVFVKKLFLSMRVHDKEMETLQHCVSRLNRSDCSSSDDLFCYIYYVYNNLLVTLASRKVASHADGHRARHAFFVGRNA